MRINFDKVDWDMTTRISYLQRRVIISCIAYYQLNDTLISDADYTELAEQLVEYQTKYKEDAEKSTYWYALNDFGVSTGFDIYSRLNEHDKEYLLFLARLIISDLSLQSVNKKNKIC